MRNRQSIGFGIVVGIERIKIAEDQEGWTLGAGRQNETGPAAALERRAVGAGDAQLGVGRDRRPAGASRRTVVIRRETDLVAP